MPDPKGDDGMRVGDGAPAEDGQPNQHYERVWCGHAHRFLRKFAQYGENSLSDKEASSAKVPVGPGWAFEFCHMFSWFHTLFKLSTHTYTANTFSNKASLCLGFWI